MASIKPHTKLGKGTVVYCSKGTGRVETDEEGSLAGGIRKSLGKEAFELGFEG